MLILRGVYMHMHTDHGFKALKYLCTDATNVMLKRCIPIESVDVGNECGCERSTVDPRLSEHLWSPNQFKPFG